MGVRCRYEGSLNLLRLMNKKRNIRFDIAAPFSSIGFGLLPFGVVGVPSSSHSLATGA